MYQGFWLLHSVYEWRKKRRRRKKKKYMNKEMQIFDYDGMKVETILHENDKGKTVPYFHGSSVAIILGYEDVNQAVRKNCTKPLKLSKLDVAKLASVSETNVTPYKALTDSGYSHGEIIAKQSWIPESDVYRLVMKSTLPAAEKFQDWVCEEVLPKIRQDGMDFSTLLSEIVVRG